MVFSKQLPNFDELDCRRLVDECRGVFNTRGVLRRGLVQTARQPAFFTGFVQRSRSSCDLHTGAMDDEDRDGAAI